jgi:hypothetical protein
MINDSAFFRIKPNESAYWQEEFQTIRLATWTRKARIL